MARVVLSKKACATNPLKSSAPLGAALAYLGMEGAVPLFHGSQGCTSFALVLAVRHFKEAIPLQTTAMNEASTVLGGADNLEEALINLQTRMKPRFIGVASTALVETRGEDIAGELRAIRRRRPELAQTAVAYASTPDYEGALEDGFSKATCAILEELAERADSRSDGTRAINVLPGVHLTPAELDELRAIVGAFGLEATFLPDMSGSLDGHVPEHYVGTSLGGTLLDGARRMGRALHTVAIGEHMRAPAQRLTELCGVPSTVLPTVSTLAGADELVALLSTLSGRTTPAALRRQRAQLLDALLDTHFWIQGKRIALAGDPDVLCDCAALVASVGAQVVAAVASTKNSPRLTALPCDEVLVGDLGDLEELAGTRGAELLVTHSHGRQAAARLAIPLYRVGFPIFDRLGAQHAVSVGYRGVRQRLFELANLFLAEEHEVTPEEVRRRGAAPAEEEQVHVHA